MTKQELIKKISDFTDWSYQYSDDHCVYKKGKHQESVLVKFGITTNDLIDAKEDPTFTTNNNSACSYMKNALVNDVLYRLEIIYLKDKFSFFCNDKNNLFIFAPKKFFDEYFEENLDLREYENKVFKIIWDSLR